MGKPQKRNLLHMALPCTGLPLIGLDFLAYPRPCRVPWLSGFDYL